MWLLLGREVTGQCIQDTHWNAEIQQFNPGGPEQRQSIKHQPT